MSPTKMKKLGAGLPVVVTVTTMIAPAAILPSSAPAPLPLSFSDGGSIRVGASSKAEARRVDEAEQERMPFLGKYLYHQTKKRKKVVAVISPPPPPLQGESTKLSKGASASRWILI